MRHELGRSNVFFVHVSLVPFMGASGEQKTKPTQHSVAALRSIGIQPDALVLRSDRPVTEANKRKIALMCDVDEAAVVNAVDVPSHLRHPHDAQRPGPRRLHHRALGLERPTRWTGRGWSEVLQAVHEPEARGHHRPGRQVHRPAGRLPLGHRGARPAGSRRRPRSRSEWIPSDECETPEGAAKALADLDGICVPGGFGIRGIEGKLGALRFARENGIPTLGLCLGLQCMVIEYSRNIAGLPGASSSEFDPDTQFPVIATMEEQVEIIAGGDLGGTMRLGLYPAELAEGSIVAELYGSTEVSRAPPPPLRGQQLLPRPHRRGGARRSRAMSPDRRLVEFVELPREVHPFYVGTQAHPELRSRPNDAHPLFRGLVGAALERQSREPALRLTTND